MERADRAGPPEAPAAIVCSAPAKLNLGLEVLARRADGYHELVSVMQTIDLADSLRFWPASDLSHTCSAPYLATEDNLVLRAARLLAGVTGAAQGAHIHLQKRIPMAAGLGGGSSDAAATLLGLAELWGISLPGEEMASLAVHLGADVPFFLRGGTALLEGIGDRITPIRRLASLWVVLAVPRLRIPRKTATLYGRLGAEHFSDGSATRCIVRRIENGQALPPDKLVNTFDWVLTEEPVQRARRAMLAAGAPWARLTGSGPGLFSLFSEEAEARRVYAGLPRAGLRRFLARTL